MRATVDEARRAIWNLRQSRRRPEIGPLLQQMAQQASHASRVPVKFEVTGRNRAVDPVVEHDILMVAREAVNNARAAWAPGGVSIQVRFESERSTCDVCDDGCGFDPDAVSPPRASISAWWACGNACNAWEATLKSGALREAARNCSWRRQ